MRAYVPQATRISILLGLGFSAIAAAVLSMETAVELAIGAGAGVVLGFAIAIPLALDHRPSTERVDCDKAQALPHMNIAAARFGYALVFESRDGDYIRYEDIETPGVGLKAVSWRPLSVVVQFSDENAKATIVGPRWAVNRLRSVAEGHPRRPLGQP